MPRRAVAANAAPASRATGACRPAGSSGTSAPVLDGSEVGGIGTGDTRPDGDVHAAPAAETIRRIVPTLAIGPNPVSITLVPPGKRVTVHLAGGGDRAKADATPRSAAAIRGGTGSG
jgi:hypothetical protein